jgi:hypothetical protein
MPLRTDAYPSTSAGHLDDRPPQWVFEIALAIARMLAHEDHVRENDRKRDDSSEEVHPK